ncbi:hypothetical protein AMTR_s00001p00269100 [Amborella trichopoda]|uniref:Uncharacterized protein n=1 Tax=Amborella trichopoda TaxID=13333 RepID=W1NMN8_AMBTC|nr:hypothetical protein AMTR_s00001p00269100 [Amborella trichopoda]
MCDQLKEATNYVTHQKEKIQELWVKRYRLRGTALRRWQWHRGGDQRWQRKQNLCRRCGSHLGRIRLRGEVLLLFMLSRVLVPFPAVCEGKEIDIIDIQEKLRHLFQR